MEKKIEDLCITLSILAKEYVSRLEEFKELYENEFVNEETYKKSIENDLFGLIRELHDEIDAIRGYN